MGLGGGSCWLLLTPSSSVNNRIWFVLSAQKSKCKKRAHFIAGFCDFLEVSVPRVPGTETLVNDHFHTAIFVHMCYTDEESKVISESMIIN